MKETAIYIFICFILFACHNTKDNTDIEVATEAIQPIPDEDISPDSLAQYFEKKGTTIKIKDALPYGNGFYIYFRLINGKAKDLNLFIQYEDHDIYQFSIDGEKYTYKTDKCKGRGDNKVCWYDYPVKTIDMKLLRSIIKSNSSRIIFSDGTSVLIEDATKEALKKTLNYFEQLGGVFPPYL